MFDIDTIMDDVTAVCEQTFGRLVTYTPKGGVPRSVLADYRLSPSTLEQGEIFVTSVETVLDIRTATLVAAGITPDNEGDVVSLVDPQGVTRTFKVTDVRQPPSIYSTHIVLGRRSS